MPAGALAVLASAAALWSLPVRSAVALEATITWEAAPGSAPTGYRVHYGTVSGIPTTHIDAGSATGRVIDSLAPLTTYYFTVTAYDSYGGESPVSEEVAYTPLPVPETVSPPAPPNGPVSGVAGSVYAYTTGGSVSSAGDAVQYQFFWSDGTASGWLPVGTSTATKAWASPGAYTDVRVQARCAAHASIESPLSEPLVVVIADAPAETVTAPFAPIGPANGQVGVAYTYATGGSVTSRGDPVQYRFSWADGTATDWLPVGTTSATKAWSAPGLYLDVHVEARCAEHPTAVSPPSPLLTVAIESGVEESVSAPAPAAGPPTGIAGTTYAFSSSGAVSDAGDPVQYRFHWGDGTSSAWEPSEPATAWKSWAIPGVYRVRVEAACALHPEINAFSAEVEVSILEQGPPLFSDDFSDGTPDGDPDWRSTRGTWAVAGPRKSLAPPPDQDSRVLARPVRGFQAGRISFSVMFRQPTSGAPRGGLVFASGNRHHRYVALSTSRLAIVQVGDTDLVPGGVKRSAALSLEARRWHRVDVDVLPDGTVRVFLNGAGAPRLTYRFEDVVPGKVGFFSARAPLVFDTFVVRDVVPP